MPSPLARSISRSVDSRTWPTLPAAPSSSSIVAVWIESTMTASGRCARAASTIRPTSCSARTWTPSADGPLSRPSRAARSRTWPGDSSPDAYSTDPPPGDRVSPAAAWRRSVDLPIPGSPPTSTSEPGTSPPPRTRSNSSMPRRRRGRSKSAMDASPVGTGPGRRRHARRRARSATVRGRPSRPGCSTGRRPGIALPSAGTTPRRTGRRSGSSAAPSLGRRVGGAGHRASTGVRGSARWMSRPASGSLSTMIVEPGSYDPSRSCSARTSSIMFWMTRRSGRAP